mmetsp:Transcript_6224/g.11442  ORF Transcript_6224/g.11442 Transcript_6224/m.11442 type:complete len:235 (+) Transcript_6224:358-1062(+)
MDSSIDIWTGGVNLIASSFPAALTLESSFCLHGLTSISWSRELSPTTMLGYTVSPGDTNSFPLASRAARAKEVALPISVETMAPFSLRVIGPLYGMYPSCMLWITPSPRVSCVNSARYPRRLLKGILNTILLRVSDWSNSIMSPFLLASFSITVPECSLAHSITNSSTGSIISPSTSFNTASGDEQASSYPSRRICSRRMPNCSSPRPCTCTCSEESLVSDRLTFVSASAMSRS